MNLRAWPRLKSCRVLVEEPIWRIPFDLSHLVFDGPRMGTSNFGSRPPSAEVTMPSASTWSLTAVSLSRFAAFADFGRTVILFVVVVGALWETFLTTFFLTVFLAI